MSTTDELLKANERYAYGFKLGDLPALPARRLAVLACMDARLAVQHILGLETGDAHIIRNAGGIATEDALRSLLISHHELGTEEFIILNHTDCGMMTFKDEELRDRLEKQTGAAAFAPAHFHAFTDLESNLRRQIERVRSHPWVPKHIPVRGFIYDVKTGRLHEVRSGRTWAA